MRPAGMADGGRNPAGRGRVMINERHPPTDTTTAMANTSIEVNHVWKKFRKGEFHDSLRELIPAMAKKVVGRGTRRDSLSEREFWALKDVSFDLQRGESLGIIGPNGAGKSTMLKLLSRIIKPNRGDYRVNGRLSALIEVGAGFHADLTGRENIYLNGTILGMTRREIKGKEDRIIDFAGVGGFIDTPVKRYSSGMVARLGFAVAAHMEPEVLLVDEVLSVGDAKFRQKCIRHMQELIRSDVSVVFISHILEQVKALCPNTLVLDHGSVVYHGPTDGAIRKYLDLLTEEPPAGEAAPAVAELRDIGIFDTDGQEVHAWQVRQPGVVECDLVVHQPVEKLSVLMNVSSIGEQYLGTANSGPLKNLASGTHRLRFTLDPMPLNDGDYLLNFSIHTGPMQNECVWSIRQPRTVTVTGGFAGSMIRMDGPWEMVGERRSHDPHAVGSAADTTTGHADEHTLQQGL